MLARLGERFDFAAGLGFRLAALLSLAILPIGLISFTQTLNLSREAERAIELSLLRRTSAAAAGERALLQGALGTADALGPAVLNLLDDSEACHALMNAFVERSAIYAYAGFTRLDGTNNCNSGGHDVSMAESPVYRKFLRLRSTVVAATGHGTVSGKSVVVVGQPLYRETELLGYVGVSLTHDLLTSTHNANPEVGEAKIVTFDMMGEILSSYDTAGENPRMLLPTGASFDSMFAADETLLHARSADGRERIFAAVTVVPGLAQAIGIFTPEDGGTIGLTAARAGAIMLPLALWGVSLAVAYFAVFRLVLRPIRELRSQMRRFAVGDRSQLPRVMTEAPAEIADVSRTFHNMARILMRDEQQLEAAVAEKTVLLKEVHHRVKNNLQLIASIISMQSRVIDDPDAKRVLRSVQDRVSSLATIYRNLYQAEHLESVEADHLVADIVDQMSAATRGLGGPMKIESEIGKLTLLPDQAVPLTLLATEALTNALKYAGAPADGQPWVRVVLRPEGEGRALLEIANSIGAARPDRQGTGLGSQLIEAFALQLDAEVDVRSDASQHCLSIHFDVESPEVADEAGRPVVLTSAARQGAVH